MSGCDLINLEVATKGILFVSWSTISGIRFKHILETRLMANIYKLPMRATSLMESLWVKVLYLYLLVQTMLWLHWSLLCLNGSVWLKDENRCYLSWLVCIFQLKSFSSKLLLYIKQFSVLLKRILYSVEGFFTTLDVFHAGFWLSLFILNPFKAHKTIRTF